jgi:esterase/lipase
MSKEELMKKEDERVTKNNENIYKKPKKKDKDVLKYRESGHDKEKVIERNTYHNGVVKSKLVGLFKDGRVVYGTK